MAGLTKEQLVNQLTYHPNQDDTTQLKLETLRASYIETGKLMMDVVPEGADRAAAARHLRESLMTAIAGVVIP